MKNARTTLRHLLGPALALGVLALAGCKEDEPYALTFSHNLHVVDNEMDCADCHGKIVDGRFTRPGHSVCADCHDEVEAKVISQKTCGICHVAKDYDALAALPATGPVARAAGAFVHTADLAKRCADCHGGLLDAKLTQVPAMTRADRVRIREQAHLWGMDCASCHVDMNRETPPPDHDQNWTRRHGVMGSQPDNACSMCHSEQSCRECHETTMPASHNNLWRLKTHGIQAAWDRDRCQVCHQEDSCTACHSETRPQSHNAAWGRNHCLQCHPSQQTGTGCTLCHGGDLIGNHPNPHPAGWRGGHCQSCHAGTHEAEQCGVCHGGGGLETHPNPHGAGWQKQHCTSCHDGRLNGVSCSACHGGDIIENHPNPHPAGWSNTHCKKCHEGSGGQSCGICHGGNLIENHPNPHTAGWRNRHCFSCHPGSAKAEECGICHEGGSSVLVHQDFWPPVHNRFGEAANCYDCHEP